jgi:RNA polymerase sigma factor (TIGR02999 family)
LAPCLRLRESPSCSWPGAKGDDRALAKLVPLVYEELRQLARRNLRGERQGHTLQPTALVHEAYGRLVNGDRIQWRGRTHFFAVAAQTMRRVLVDHARKRHAAKRGGRGSGSRSTIRAPLPTGATSMSSLSTTRSMVSPLWTRRRQSSELRYFSGLGIEETAESLGVSPATVKREWSAAKAWLYREMTKP